MLVGRYARMQHLVNISKGGVYIGKAVCQWNGNYLLLHLFAVNLGASARCLEIVHSISTIRHSARLFGTIAPYSAWKHPLST